MAKRTKRADELVRGDLFLYSAHKGAMEVERTETHIGFSGDASVLIYGKDGEACLRFASELVAIEVVD